MRRGCKVLLGLLLFNGLSATVGGLALMTDWIPEQASWVRDTDFPSNYFPGVILMAVVGGSSLIAAAGLEKRSDGWQLASIVAGTIMVFWIIGEVASIRGSWWGAMNAPKREGGRAIGETSFALRHVLF